MLLLFLYFPCAQLEPHGGEQEEEGEPEHRRPYPRAGARTAAQEGGGGAGGLVGDEHRLRRAACPPREPPPRDRPLSAGDGSCRGFPCTARQRGGRGRRDRCVIFSTFSANVSVNYSPSALYAHRPSLSRSRNSKQALQSTQQYVQFSCLDRSGTN